MKSKPSAPGTERSIWRSEESVLVREETMADFAGLLSRRPDVNAIVIDNTGLAGRFDFTIPYVDVGGNGKCSGWCDARNREAHVAAVSLTFEAVNSIGLRLIKPEKRNRTGLSYRPDS
jgi:uncharacterized protein (TIGR03435 family)